MLLFFAMKKIYTTLTFLLLTLLVRSSDLQILFNDSLMNTEGRSVKMLNGSFYFMGHAEDSIGNIHTVLTKLDKAGNVLWWKLYGDSAIYQAPYLNVTDSNQLIVVNEKVSGSNTDFEIMKLDTFGNVLWVHTYGIGAKNESLKYVEQTADNGFIGCGFISQSSLTANDFLIVKFDSAGNITWQNEYGTNKNDYAKVLQRTSNGNYIVSGDSYNGHDYDNYLLLIDSTGNEIWHRVIGDVYDNGNQTVFINHEGDFILCGESTTAGSFEFDIYLAAISSQGNFLWSRYMGGNGSDAGFAIQENSAHQYFITGYSSSIYNGAPYTAYLLKLDSVFHPIGLKYFLQPDLTICYDEIILNDSSFALAGISGSNFYLVLTTDSGYTDNFTEHDLVSHVSPLSASAFEVEVFKTSKEKLQVKIVPSENATNNTFDLFDVCGRLLFKNQFSDFLCVDLSGFETFCFVWRVEDEHGNSTTGKFIRYKTFH